MNTFDIRDVMENYFDIIEEQTVASLIKSGAYFMGISAGAAGLTNYLRVPGSSKLIGGWLTLNDTDVIHDHIILDADAKFVSQEVAVKYAELASYMFNGSKKGALYTGVTASLATNYDKRAADQAYLAMISNTGSVGVHIVFENNLSDFSKSELRTEQNYALCSAVFWMAGHLGYWGNVSDSEVSMLQESAVIKEATTWDFSKTS